MDKKIAIIIGGLIGSGLAMVISNKLWKDQKEHSDMKVEEANKDLEEYIQEGLDEFANKFNSLNYDEQQEFMIDYFAKTRG